MIILLTLIAFYMLVLLIGKSVRRISFLGYVFIGIITAIEVGVVMFLLFTMETPTI